MRGAIRQTRVGRLDAVGAHVPDETNELISGTVVDVGGVQVGVLNRGYGALSFPFCLEHGTQILRRSLAWWDMSVQVTRES